MPVVINRSNSGGGSPPDKNGGKKAVPKPAAKAAPKAKKGKGGDASILEDPRVRIGGLIALVVIAVLVVMFSMGFFSGEAPPPVNAPPTTPGASATGAGGAAGPGTRSGPGMRPGAPIPGGPGEDTESAGGGSQLPKGSGP